MFVRRISTIALLCALILAVPLVSQPQASGPRAELGPQATEAHPDYGAVEGKHYVNGYFGFSYAFPDGWKANAVQSSNAAASQYALLTANPESSGGADMRYITIVADPLPKNTTPKTFMDAALKSFASPEAGFEVLHADKHYTFGGKQFYRLDLVSKVAPGAPVFYQTQVFVLMPSYAITFSFMAANPNDIESMIHGMESLSFGSAVTPMRGTTEAKSQPQAR